MGNRVEDAAFDERLAAVVPPPKTLAGLPTAERVKAKTTIPGTNLLRRRWRTIDGTIYEWDYQHGTVERYSKRGMHQGEFDGETGEQTGPAVPNRRVDP